MKRPLAETLLCRRSSWGGRCKKGCLTLALTALVTLSFTAAYASAGGEGEGGKNWLDFGWRAFNFAVLAGLLYWLLAAKVRDFFSNRRQEIKSSLTAAEAAQEEAKRKFAEYDAKLNKATEEIEELAKTIRAQGLVEKERIIADAERNARKMKEDAGRRMEQELKKARHDLQVEAVRLSVQLAEGILKKQVTPADHLNMVEDIIKSVATKH